MITHADLDDLYDELQRGKVYECRLRDPRWHVDGLQMGEAVFIDPRPSTIETLLHELIHRRHPRWGERRVRLKARRCIAKMDEPAMRRWWGAYQRIKVKGRPVDA